MPRARSISGSSKASDTAADGTIAFIAFTPTQNRTLALLFEA